MIVEMKRTTILLVAGLLVASVGQAQQDTTSGASPMRRAATVEGYLAEGDHPDTVALLPPPPAPGSAALALDKALNQEALALRGSARWDMAAQDAIPEPGRGFSCALGIPLNAEDTPRLYRLLRRSVADVGQAVTTPKNFYKRKRPFLINEQPICVPGSEENTGRDGSYPSGHTAAGWVWGLILAEVAPERMDEVLARGWEYGQSRAVCNVHWQSDVTAGRTVGTALVARLHANEEFRADLEASRKEINAMRAKGATPGRDCKAEAAALAK